MLCPPANPSAGPLEVSGPHFEKRRPKWLIKLLYFRAPYGHREQRKHLLGGPPRDTFSFYGGPAINTITAIGWRVSPFAPPLSGFCPSQGSKWTSRDDKFHKFSPLFERKKKKSHAVSKWGLGARTLFHCRFHLR